MQKARAIWRTGYGIADPACDARWLRHHQQWRWSHDTGSTTQPPDRWRAGEGFCAAIRIQRVRPSAFGAVDSGAPADPGLKGRDRAGNQTGVGAG